MRIPRPIATALLCSFLLHLMVAVAVLLWLPEREHPGPAGHGIISVSLARMAQSPEPPPAPSPTERPALPAPDLPLPPAPAPGRPALPDLNPVPQLREEFSIPVATLALQSPMSRPEVQSLQAALNRFAGKLPDWTTTRGSDDAPTLEWHDGGRDYQITWERLQPAGPMDLERAVVTVATERGGMALRARMPVKRVAFSHFAQVVNRWDPEVSLAGDAILGRFHSNSSLTVDVGSGPRVTGRATVAGRVKMSGRGDRAGVFPSGLETGAARIPMAERPFDPSVAAAGSLHRIAVDSRIRFHGDGSYAWSAPTGEAPGARVVPDRQPWLIIAEGDAELSVEGEVNGSFLVYSPRRISITGSLRYAVDPRVTRSDDFLGLVSDGTVEIAGPGMTGTGDLEVCAAIYAGRQFRVRKYRLTNGGRLGIYGSVTAGSLTATEPRFTTRLEFDPRLEDLRPAWFPMTNRYVAERSDLHWTIESIAAHD